jgi:extradiol dioxygenase family protein
MQGSPPFNLVSSHGVPYVVRPFAIFSGQASKRSLATFLITPQSHASLEIVSSREPSRER